MPISECVEVAVDSSLYVLEFDEETRKKLETLEGKPRELNWFCGWGRLFVSALVVSLYIYFGFLVLGPFRRGLQETVGHARR